MIRITPNDTARDIAEKMIDYSVEDRIGFSGKRRGYVYVFGLELRTRACDAKRDCNAIRRELERVIEEARKR